MLSGYRQMWIMVMFDLPAVERIERKAANDFRNSLLDMGFEMSQFSIYIRFCSSFGKIETYCKKIEKNLPAGGKVNILQLTNKQYERIISFHGRTKQRCNKSPDQYNLF